MSPARVRPPIVLTAIAALLARWPRFALRLADWETRALEDLLGPDPVAPIWVTGLARSGSTLLIELLARHPDVGTHRHRDFPLLVAPWWWSLAVSATPRLPARPRERAHGDGMLVTPESADAYEEMIWALSGAAGDGFARLLRDHLRKVLYLRRRTRYAAKANEHLARLSLLRRLHPDARFVVPVRDPVAQVASLMRQHERFMHAGRLNARVPRHMRLVGHTEFGLLREPPACAAPHEAASIRAAWAAGDEVGGWAIAWRAAYSAVRAAQEGEGASSIQVLRFEDLCADPRSTLRALLVHCALDPDEALVQEFAARVAAPRHEPLSAIDAARVRATVGDVGTAFGYPDGG